MKKPLHPALAQRAAASAVAYRHLSQHHPGWQRLSQTERFKAVHGHIDRQAQGLRGVVQRQIAGRSTKGS